MRAHLILLALAFYLGGVVASYDCLRVHDVASRIRHLLCAVLWPVLVLEDLGVTFKDWLFSELPK